MEFQIKYHEKTDQVLLGEINKCGINIITNERANIGAPVQMKNFLLLTLLPGIISEI
jgi:hypothetical protein